ncbi:MAG: stage sporulation protein [Oscillospiraceae bacterium]|nr:stage sporulation protein [Oscillospiraceae bacterium]
MALKLNRSSSMYSIVLLTVTAIITQGLGFVYRVAMSRMVGAEVMGLYQLIMPVYSVVMSLTAIGLTVAVSRLSAEYHALGRQKSVQATLSRCLLLFFALFLPIGAAGIAGSDPISVYLLGDARTQLGLILLIPCIFFTGIENIHKHCFYGVGNVRPPAAVETLEQVVRMTAVLGLLFFFAAGKSEEKTVGLIVAGMVICEIFSSTCLVALFRKHLAGRESRSDAEPASLRRIASIAVPVGLTSLLGTILSSANAVLIPQLLVIAGMNRDDAIASFGVLFGMTIPLLYLPSALIAALGLVLVPKLSESIALKQPEAVRRRIHRALLGTSVLVMPFTALLTVVGPTLGVLMFGDPGVGNYLRELSLPVLLSSYQGILGTALNGLNRQGAAARNAIVCNVIQLVFTALLVRIPGVGLLGFVIGFAVSTVVGLVANWRSVVKTTNIKLNVFEWMVAPALATILMALCVNLLYAFLCNGGISVPHAALISFGFGGVLYVLTLQLQGVSLRTLFRIS